MLKSVVIFFVVLSGPSAADLVVAQNYAANSTSNRIVSPEAKAEAKRLYKEGVKYGVAGLFSQAAEIFERAVKLDPQNADAHFALGHAYFDLEQWRKAAKSFERAVQLNPRDQQATEFLSLARSLAYQGPPRAASRAEPSSNPEGVQVSITAKPEPPLSQPPPPKAESSNDETDKAIKANAAANEVALTKIYRVGPGDVLDVRINDSASPQSTLFTITPTGLLEHPLLAEPLQVGGLTVDEISGQF